MGGAESAERGGTEVYSGCSSCSAPDPTLELVRTQSGSTVDEWSVMSSGAERDQYIRPTEATYFSFSLEELLTVSTEDTQVTGP